MNRIHRILSALAGLACAALAFIATGPAALAQQSPGNGAAAVLLDRARSARRGGAAESA